MQPRAPLSQPGAAVISLPSTVAPEGAEKLKVVVRGVRIIGSTIYSAEDLEPLYADLIGREVAVTAIYDVAQRITAKYGNDGYVLSRAIVPPQELTPARRRSCASRSSKAISTASNGRPSLSKYRDFFSQYAAKITAERPINVRTLERYLLLASDLPGLKFTNSLRGLAETKQGAATLVVEVVEKPVDYVRPRRQSRHQGARAAAVFQQPQHQQSRPHARNPGRSAMPARSRPPSCNTGC